MLYWTIGTTIASIILILLVHHLITFFTYTLTVPKFKDLVNAPTQKYEEIFNIINNNINKSSSSDINYLPSSTYKSNNLGHSLPMTTSERDNDQSKPNMKDELKQFMKKQLDNNIQRQLY